MKTLAAAGLLLSSLVAVAVAAPEPPMRVLVTNDDGVGAPGIDALVTALAANPNLDLVVIAKTASDVHSAFGYV